MPTDPTQGDAPQVDITARPDDVSLRAPDTNPALQLAASLAQTSEDLHPFLNDLSSQLNARATAKAQADALKASGKPLAEAVRSGQIEPTQNPWYMHAYETASAQVRGQAQVSAFVTQMQSDPSRNDPAAYATKFNAGLGQIAQQFTGLNAAQGFHQAADPLAREALSQNTEYNVQRIQQEHVQNTTTLATQALMDTLKANPKASTQDLFKATDDQHASWIGVGGTEPQWRLILKQAFVGAGANLGDASVLDNLKEPYEGTASIANQADETGKPTALEISSDKFWIDRGVDASLVQDFKARQAQIAKEGSQVDDWAQANYGNDYAFGKIPMSQLQSDGLAQGFSGNAIMWAAAHQGESLRAASGYSVGQTDIYSSDPVVQQRILGVNREAITGGLTPHLTGELTDMLGRHQITLDMANSVMDRAAGQSHWSISESKEDARSAASLARADAGLQLQKWSLVGDASKGALGKAAVALSTFGIDYGKLPSKAQEQLKTDIDNAAMAAGEKGPQAAQDAAENAAAKLVPVFVHRFHPSSAPPGLAARNPNAPIPGQP